MEIYLPIAEMSVHWLTILGMAAAIGYLSGLLGVGGAFLLTPLLIFYGIPPSVAVATTASHLTASSMAGAIAMAPPRRRPENGGGDAVGRFHRERRRRLSLWSSPSDRADRN